MFKIIKKSAKSKARACVIKTAHGQIQTPFFMPDATRGVLKNVSNQDLEALGLQSMVVNTYHLYLQPGMDLIKKAGNVHKFMSTNKPLLSDSGGYQVFSLIYQSKGTRQQLAQSGGQAGSIYKDKIEFKSPLNGAKHELTSEKSIQIQFELGTDMIVCLDDCPPNSNSKKLISESVKRTIAWAKRCKKEYDKQEKRKKKKEKIRPLLFGVIQGGANKDLRKKCADELIKIGFDGFGFGARPVDENKKFLGDVLDYTADLIPEKYLRFGLGIGSPQDIVKCVKMGWDMFDCVIPTREGRHGRLYVKTQNSIPSTRDKKQGFYNILNITNSKFSSDFTPINKNSKLQDLREYSLAYLHHLFKVGEPLAQRLATLNNLEFYLDLMKEIRSEIKNDNL